jgi:hypothetical protein
VLDTGCGGVPGPEECAVGDRVVWFSTISSGATHFVHDNVQMPGVVMVKLSPPVVIVVGTAPHEVVNTTTVINVISGVHVRTVVQGVGMAKI